MTIAGFILLVLWASAALGADVQVVCADLGLGAITNRKVTLTPSELRVSGTNLVVIEPRTQWLTNGLAWFSNTVAGLYKLEISGAPPSSGQILVPDMNGVLNAATLIVTSTNLTETSGRVAWSAAAADARYATAALSSAAILRGENGAGVGLLHCTNNSWGSFSASLILWADEGDANQNIRLVPIGIPDERGGALQIGYFIGVTNIGTLIVTTNGGLQLGAGGILTLWDSGQFLASKWISQDVLTLNAAGADDAHRIFFGSGGEITATGGFIGNGASLTNLTFRAGTNLIYPHVAGTNVFWSTVP